LKHESQESHQRRTLLVASRRSVTEVLRSNHPRPTPCSPEPLSEPDHRAPPIPMSLPILDDGTSLGPVGSEGLFFTVLAISAGGPIWPRGNSSAVTMHCFIKPPQQQLLV